MTESGSSKKNPNSSTAGGSGPGSNLYRTVCPYPGHGKTGIVNLIGIDYEEYEDEAKDPKDPDKTVYFEKGNRLTCWFNAVIQCLGHTDPLRKFFIETDAEDIFSHTKSQTVAKVAYAIQMLIMQMWSNKYTVVRPDHALAHVFTYASDPLLSMYFNLAKEGQKDCMEFYEFFIECLKYAYSFDAMAIDSGITSEKQDDEVESLMVKVTNKRKKHCSIPLELFRIYETHEEICKKCGIRQVTLTDEYSIRVSALRYVEDQPIFTRTLDGILILFYTMDEETRFGSTIVNMLKQCPSPKCTGKFCNYSRRIFELPTILVIQLEFVPPKADPEADPEGGPEAGPEAERNVLNYEHYVEFPQTLDVGDYIFKKDQRKVKDTEYELYGIICNATQDWNSGHYFAYAKPSHDSGRKEWYKFDDHIIGAVDENEVISIKTYKSVRILFYRRNISDPDDPIYAEPKFKEEPQKTTSTSKGGKAKVVEKETSSAKSTSGNKRKNETKQKSRKKKTSTAPEYVSPHPSDHEDPIPFETDTLPSGIEPAPSGARPTSGNKRKKETKQKSKKKKTSTAPEYVSPHPSDHEDSTPFETDTLPSATEPAPSMPIFGGLESAAAGLGTGHVSYEKGNEPLPETRGKAKAPPKAKTAPKASSAAEEVGKGGPPILSLEEVSALAATTRKSSRGPKKGGPPKSPPKRGKGRGRGRG